MGREFPQENVHTLGEKFNSLGDLRFPKIDWFRENLVSQKQYKEQYVRMQYFVILSDPTAICKGVSC